MSTITSLFEAPRCEWVRCMCAPSCETLIYVDIRAGDALFDLYLPYAIPSEGKAGIGPFPPDRKVRPLEISEIEELDGESCETRD